MIPLYLMEFSIVYAKQIPYLKDTMDHYFVSQHIFDWDLKMPILEQWLFFIILSLFVMMISGLKASLQIDGDDHGGDMYFNNIYKKKLISSHTSILWKLTLYPLRRVHYLIFIILFVIESRTEKSINHFMNLGFIFFFAVYITFDWLYRKTAIILLVFMSWFIISQYYYSLHYKVISTDSKINLKCEWWGMWLTNNKPEWKDNSSIYFRYAPDVEIWVLLIIFKLLNVINVLLRDRGEVVKLETKCYQSFRHTYPNIVSTYNNVKVFITNILIYVYILIMIFYMMNMSINLLSFLLVVQNIALISLVCK